MVNPPNYQVDDALRCGSRLVIIVNNECPVLVVLDVFVPIPVDGTCLRIFYGTMWWCRVKVEWGGIMVR